MTLFTALCASCSTASPGYFSGAPVRESPEPSTPAAGFLTPPVELSIKDGGAGGKQNDREDGKRIRTTINTSIAARRQSKAQAIVYAARNVDVRLHSRQDRSRVMCFQRWKAPTKAVMYSLSKCVLNLTGVKTSSLAISRSKLSPWAFGSQRTPPISSHARLLGKTKDVPEFWERT
jgi:hypothetical protein